jgi:hypothetical protein
MFCCEEGRDGMWTEDGVVVQPQVMAPVSLSRERGFVGDPHAASPVEIPRPPHDFYGGEVSLDRFAGAISAAVVHQEDAVVVVATLVE